MPADAIAANDIIQLGDGTFALYRKDGTQSGNIIIRQGQELGPPGTWYRDAYDSVAGGGSQGGGGGGGEGASGGGGNGGGGGGGS